VMDWQIASDEPSAITRKVEERGPDDNYTAVAVRVLDGAGGDTMPAPRRDPVTASAASAAGARPSANEAPRNLFNPPAEVDVNGPRRSSKTGGIALLLALLALGLAGYAAFAASQNRGGDPALTAQVDSLRNEVRTLRARAAVPTDSLGLTVDSAAMTAAPGAVAPTTTAPPPVQPPAGGQTTTGTRPATPTKQP
jgi:hypothetical protein